eukprot:UN10854
MTKTNKKKSFFICGSSSVLRIWVFQNKMHNIIKAFERDNQHTNIHFPIKRVLTLSNKFDLPSNKRSNNQRWTEEEGKRG